MSGGNSTPTWNFGNVNNSGSNLGSSAPSGSGAAAGSGSGGGSGSVFGGFGALRPAGSSIFGGLTSSAANTPSFGQTPTTSGSGLFLSGVSSSATPSPAQTGTSGSGFSFGKQPEKPQSPSLSGAQASNTSSGGSGATATTASPFTLGGMTSAAGASTPNKPSSFGSSFTPAGPPPSSSAGGGASGFFAGASGQSSGQAGGQKPLPFGGFGGGGQQSSNLFGGFSQTNTPATSGASGGQQGAAGQKSMFGNLGGGFTPKTAGPTQTEQTSTSSAPSLFANLGGASGAGSPAASATQSGGSKPSPFGLGSTLSTQQSSSATAATAATTAASSSQLSGGTTTTASGPPSLFLIPTILLPVWEWYHDSSRSAQSLKSTVLPAWNDVPTFGTWCVFGGMGGSSGAGGQSSSGASNQGGGTFFGGLGGASGAAGQSGISGTSKAGGFGGIGASSGPSAQVTSTNAPATSSPTTSAPTTTAPTTSTPSLFAPATSAGTATTAPKSDTQTATAGPQDRFNVRSTLGASTAGDPKAAQMSRLRNKSMDEIITRWATDLSKYQKEFQKQAQQVATWDRLLVENSDKISKLYTRTFQAERDAAEVERQLNIVENQQGELAAWLDKYELEVDELVAREVGGGLSDGQLQGPDQEREKTYKLAEKLTERINGLNKDLADMIGEINSVSATLTKNNKPDDPLTAIVRVLNGHLLQLQKIDTGAANLQKKVAEAQKEGQRMGANGYNGVSHDQSEDFMRSFRSSRK
ncbi:Nsp1-like C-terminal region-domain-containing protein [Lineolata rhizophorae]|uniref:Nucleoporin NSP1 n=1 Tax=Lineolata rhizophorae TaxID=578093 RepID=A0A6A6NT49_9PEZI|nr:Nsp1-like C-terminal region-domain-containing protein [Lineolata rhizophorae]